LPFLSRGSVVSLTDSRSLSVRVTSFDREDRYWELNRKESRVAVGSAGERERNN
jgi:hypothetical protein